MKKQRIIILGAAGRDFHNFNVVYKNNRQTEVIAFTATQIPGIEERKYPPILAGKFYSKGIPIESEESLEKIVKEKRVEECVLSYSDLSYPAVMRLASRVLVSGAKFSMLGIDQTMLKSKKPVIAIVAVRTGCGKSQTTRRVVEILREAGKRVVSIRHPMPYGDLTKQVVQRFETLDDLKKHRCTIEEMEEYEPHIAMGSIVYAGIDYQAILKKAEREADVIVWDGGNNDTSFYKPNLMITVVDPLRPGHELSYYPGEINFRLADVILINKIDAAKTKDVQAIIANAKKFNPSAKIIKAASVLKIDNPSILRKKQVLVIEDGPTVTHGEMQTGAGTVAAQRSGAREFINPRPFATGAIKDTFRKYPNIGNLLPAMGYGEQQMKDLEKTISRVACDAIVIGTPIDLTRFIKIKKPCTRVRYDLSENTKRDLQKIIHGMKLI